MIKDPTFKAFIRYPNEPDGFGIYVHAKLNGDNWLDYDIWKVDGLEEDESGEYDNPYISSHHDSMTGVGAVEESIYLSGFIKWDGCAQWSYNQEENCEFAHFDSREDALKFHTLVVNTIYDLGKALIPRWLEL